jgi:hypothetical protein
MSVRTPSFKRFFLSVKNHASFLRNEANLSLRQSDLTKRKSRKNGVAIRIAAPLSNFKQWE